MTFLNKLPNTLNPLFIELLSINESTLLSIQTFVFDPAKHRDKFEGRSLSNQSLTRRRSV